MEDGELKRKKRMARGSEKRSQYGSSGNNGKAFGYGSTGTQHNEMLKNRYDDMNKINGRLGKGGGNARWGNKFDDMNRYDWRNEKDDMDWDDMDGEDWKDNDDDVEDEWEDFMENIMKCDGQKRCGKNKFLQELSSCICQSFWSRNSDPTGALCQAIPRETRTQLVNVITMFVKEKGPGMPENETMLWEFGRLGAMWKQHWEKLFILPFEKQDMQVILWQCINIYEI